MQTPADRSATTINTPNWATSLPPVLWSAPVLVSGIFFGVWSAHTGTASPILTNLLSGMFCFWLLCVWQMYRVVRHGAGSTDAPSANVAAIANLITGPPAVFIASWSVGWMVKGLTAFADLVFEMFPNSTPIANSALYLVEDHATLVAIGIAVAASLVTQVKLSSRLRTALATKAQLNKCAFNAAAVLIAVSLVAPGCIWQAGNDSMLGILPAEPQWQSCITLFAYICALTAFLTLGWMNQMTASALAAAQPTTELR